MGMNIKQIQFGMGALVIGLAQALIPSPALGAAPATVSATVRTSATKSAPETADFAGGCFWSMEAIFKQLKGVEKVTPGYAGGHTPYPSYGQVETGTTGHAETLQIVFDPAVISYHDLLQVFFTMRDPTTPNRQGPDVGTQYRSIIFYRDNAQKKDAQQEIQAITADHLWKNPVVTEVVPYTNFYHAEAYHYNYYARHPNEPYCKYVIAPEISEFRAKFRSELKR